MRRLIVVAVLGGLMAGLAGCATTVWYGSPTNLKSHTFSVGMPKQQVHSLYGSPQHIVTQQLGDVMVETWKYLDKTLIFHNNLLHSWSTSSGQPPPQANPPSPEGFPQAL